MGLACLFASDVRANEQNLPPFVFPPALNKVDFTLPEMESRSSAELQLLWEDALDDPETDGAAWEHLALQYFLQDRFDRVLEAAQRAGPKTSLSITLQRVLAMTYEAEGDWEQAYRQWSIVHGADPEDSVPPLRMAVAKLHLNEGAVALQFLRERVAHRPNQPTALHLLGALYWLDSQPRMAWRSLARAAATGRASPETFLFLAWISVQDGEHNEATGWLRRALTDQPPVEQARMAALSHFDALRDHPSYEYLLSDLGLSRDAIRTAVEQRPLPPEIGAQVNATPAAPPLPESLRVTVRLQDTNEAAAPLWEPGAGETGLRLGLTPSAPDDDGSEIIWHEPE